MSLINDALKRAKDTQPPALTAAAGPSLHPVASERRAGSEMLLLLLALVILLLAGLLMWEWFLGARYELKVRANTFRAATAQPAPVEASQPPVVPPQPATALAPVSENNVTNAPAKPEVTEPAPSVAAIPEPPKPQPLSYKLQGIFYYAKNPSAVINGKTVYVGSLVGDVQVVAIGKDSATIMTASGQTKVLDLP